MAGDPHRPLSPPLAAGRRGDDLPAYVSNGLIGLRLLEDPLRPGLCIVSGFVGEHHERKVEAAVAAPFPLGLDIALDGEWASDHVHVVEPLDQAHDFETGELTTRARIRIGERTAEIETVAFCSRTHPTIVCQQVTVRADAACDLSLRARIPVAGLRGRVLERRLDTPGEPEPACDGSMLWASEGDMGFCGVALASEGPAGGECERRDWDDLGPLATTWAVRAAKGRPARLAQIVSLVPDALHRQPHRQAVRLVANAAEIGFDDLRRRNRAAWADIWKGRIRLVGAGDRWQALTDAAVYYLAASTHRSSPASTSIYGLATWKNYHYYFGHVMWDVDAFAAPPLTLLQPDAARSLLDFRSRTRQAARNNARMQGRLGLQFPWEAGARHGEETAPGGGSAAVREIHVNMHVARAFAFWADATGDDRFLREEAWPILAGVCDWIVDRVEAVRGGYVFRELGGPAENPGFIDEDAVTTLTARVMLEKTIAVAARLEQPADPRWTEVARGLHPPMRADGAIASHADYAKDEPKGATPSPLLAIFPFWADIDPDTARRTLDFYLAQWPDYAGSPMLAALYGAWAAWTGDRDLSLKLFEEGYGLYQTGRFAQTLEYRLDKDFGDVASGPFIANIGGFLTALLFGLPGLKVSDAEPADWPSRPVVLPAGWRAVECDRLWVRGRPARLVARHGAERAELSFG